MTTKQHTDTKRYFNKPDKVPRKVPAGRVLAHNHIKHTTIMGHGVNGFRCWSWPKGQVPRDFKECRCGWSGLPHVASRKSSGKCVSIQYFNRYLND
jgi:hypothetical protein